MILLPIVVREFRAVAGRPYLYTLRVLAAGLGVAVMAWLLLVDTTGAFSLDGRRLLQALAYVALLYCLLAGSITTVNSISTERREGTLGLLFLTDLRGLDVVLGKMAVAALPLLGAILGFLPLLAVSLLVGGVSPRDVGLMALVMANTLFLSLSIGLLISAVSRQESRSLTAAILAPLALAFGPYLAGEFFHGSDDKLAFTQLPALWLSLSPLFSLSLVQEDPGGVFRASDFYRSLGLLHGMALGCLVAAAAWTTHLSRERTPLPWVRGLQRWMRDWVFGTGVSRSSRRARLLEINPVLWLAMRHRHKTAYLWVFVASLAIIAMWSGTQTRGIWFEWKPALGYLLLMHGAMTLCLISESCHRLGLDRQQGGYELLLTTPASVETLAEGHRLGLIRTFAGPVAALMGLDLIWLWMDWERPSSDHDRWLMVWVLMVLWIGYFADWMALRWVSLWQMVLAPTAAKAAQTCVLFIQWAPMILFLGIVVPAGWVGRSTQPAKGREAVVIGLLAGLWLVLGLLNASWWRWRSRNLFLQHCRRLASEGILEWQRQPTFVWLELARHFRDHWRDPWTMGFWKARPLTSAVMGCLCVMIAIVGLLQIPLQRRLQAEIESLRLLKVPLTSEELIHWNPPVMESSNAIPVLRVALDHLNVAPGVRVEPVVLPHRNRALTSRQRALYESLLQTNAAAMAALRTSLERSEVWFDSASQFVISPGRFRGSLPLRLSGLLLAQVALDTEQGHVENACQGILKALQLAELVGRQPRCLGQNVRHATIHQAIDGIERLLSQGDVSADQMEPLTQALQKTLHSSALSRALIGEQWLVLEAWRSGRYTISGTIAGGGSSLDFPERLRLAVGRYSGLAGDEFLQVLAMMRQGLLAGSGTEELQLPLGTLLRDTNGPVGHFFTDATQIAQNLGGTLVGNLVCNTRVRAALVGLELERHMSEPGAVSEALLERLLANPARLDPFSGKRFKCRLEGTSYSISSVALHGEDISWITRLTGRELDQNIGFAVDRRSRRGL